MVLFFPRYPDRLAAPAPCGTSPHQNALWRAARHWRSTGSEGR